MLALDFIKSNNFFRARDLRTHKINKASHATDLIAEAAHAKILALSLHQRHVEIDNAVLAGYGRNGEILLAQDFYQLDYLTENASVRFTARGDIFKLNHERHAAEIARGPDDKMGNGKAARKNYRPTRPDQGDPTLRVAKKST